MNMFDLWLNRRFAGGKFEKDYIEFVDPVVAQICANTWGDGVGLTYGQAAAVTSLGTVFRGNTDIVSFDELQYFTGLASIDSNAFFQCSNLESVTLSSNTTYISSNAFYACINLESVTIGASSIQLGSSCFAACTNLTSFDFSKVTSISSGAFSNAGITGTLYLPNVSVLYYAAFSNCPITEVNLPNVSAIYASGGAVGTFSGCTQLATVSVPKVTTLGEGIFSGCTSLASISLPLIRTIETSCFSGCSSLSSVTVGNSLTSIGSNAFDKCTSLTSINWSSSLRTIGSSAFSSCALSSISPFPSGLTSIGSEAFKDCVFTSVDIPSTCSSIGASAFALNTSQLLTVVVRRDTPPTLGKNAFYYKYGVRYYKRADSNLEIYVPASYVDTYKAASNWSTYANSFYAISE